MPEDRRAAERVELKKPIEAMLVDVPAKIVEISLINCRLEHTGKVAMGSNVTLQFDWSGEKVKLKGKLTRSEMRPIGGKLSYASSMQFADSIEAAPPVVRRMIAALLSGTEEPQQPPPAAAPPPKPPAPTPKAAAPAPPPSPRPPQPAPAAKAMPKAAPAPVAAEEEIEEIEAAAEIPPVRYIQCTLEQGKWSVREVKEPRQPREGFTMLAPDNAAEIDGFCKTYEFADPETRRMIRLSFELAISRVNG